MVWASPLTSGISPSARNAHSVTTYGNKLIMFGGHSGYSHLFDINILDTDTLVWTQPSNDNHF